MATKPDGLGPKSGRLWDDVTGDFELRADELRLLEDACREIDLVERLEEALAVDTLTVDGSQGQPVANPLIQEIRQHRTVVARLLTLLKLPSEASPDGGDRSAAARAAAGARWANGA